MDKKRRRSVERAEPLSESEWRDAVRASLSTNQNAFEDGSIEQLVDEAYRLAVSFVQTAKRRAPSEIARETGHSARVLRAASQVIAKLVSEKSGAIGAVSALKLILPRDDVPTVLTDHDVAKLIRVVKDIAKYLKLLSIWIDDKNYASFSKLVQVTPSEILIQQLCVLWARANAVGLTELRIGNVDQPGPTLRFLIAATAPLKGERAPRGVSAATLRRHAQALRNRATKLGDDETVSVVQMLADFASD